jgi:protein subunit release factor B
MAAVAVVFNGSSSIQWRLMASAMDYDERTRGRRKGRQRKQEGGASRGQQEMMAQQPAGTTRQREAARQDDKTTRGWHIERRRNNLPAR